MQVALGWLLAQGDDVAPIPGTKRVSRVEEHTAADRIELTGERRSGLPVKHVVQRVAVVYTLAD